MVAFTGTQDQVLAVLQAVSSIVSRRHTLPILAKALMRRGSGVSVSNGFPESGGGGGALVAAFTSATASAAGAADACEAASSETPAASADDDGDGDGEDDWRRSSKKHPSPGSAPHSRGTARTGTRNAAKFLPPAADPELTLCRLPQVLTIIPVGRSTWWAGVKSGRFPQPLRLSARCSVWRLSDIRALVASL